MKKIVIAGTRSFDDYDIAREFINKTLKSIVGDDSVTIITGGCRGADRIGEKYAMENGLNIEKFNADWARYKRAAGPIRNKEMVLAADAVICFWDNKSKGTSSLIQLCEKYEKRVYIKIIDE